MKKWSEVDFSTLVLKSKKGGGSKITYADGTPFRFQVPTGRVMYDGISNFKSFTLEMPPDFLEWWARLDAEFSKEQPYRSNVSNNGLRVKVDPTTYFFDESKKTIFPNIEEGGLKGESLTCIIEIPGTYFFQETYGLIVRAYQVVLRTTAAVPVAAAAAAAAEDQLKGFAFLNDA